MLTDRVDLIVLPFRGQQVWRYVVDGENLTMRTHFDEPARSTVFPETYGGFLVHCGLTGIGAPSPADAHPHHGELPNAHYEDAELFVGESTEGEWIGIGGTFRMRVSHSIDVEFMPFLALRAGTTALDLTVGINNRRLNNFDYSYLCHVNFPIFDNSTLIQTVTMDEAHFELAPASTQDGPTADYTRKIAVDLDVSNTLKRTTPVVPEYCAILTPHADEDGWAHFLQVRDDGSAAAVSYETTHLPHAVRWISNTGDEEAAGFCLPSTGHHRGRAAAERDNMVQSLAGGVTREMRFVIDLLPPVEARTLQDHIQRVNTDATPTR